MNFLQHIYPGDVIASFVIRVLAEITLVTVAAFVLTRLIARKNAAMRHGICVCALLCVVSAPLTTLGLEQAGWSTFSIRLESDKQPLTTVAIPYGEQVVPVIEEESRPFWTLERARDTASLIILIWALGTGVLVYRLFNGSRKVRALRKSAREIDDPKLRAALAAIAFPTRAPVRFSKRLHSPVVVGPRRTMVILPEKLLAQLDEDQLRCVLAHELTHVRQRDPLVGLIQRLVEAGYWPHPMVHVLNRDLVRAREEVCDNAALNGTTAPQYADTLLTVALGMSPQHATLGIGLMTKRWRLEERVKGLLDPQRRLTTTMNTRHLAFVLVALAAGTAIIAGAHVVAAPNPPSLQQALDLYSHYNPKTKKVTVTSKLTQVKAAKQVKSAKTYKTSLQGALNVLPKGQTVRVRYVPGRANPLEATTEPLKLEFTPVEKAGSQKPNRKGAFLYKDAAGKTQTIQFDTFKADQLGKNQPVIQFSNSVGLSRDATVVESKPLVVNDNPVLSGDLKVKNVDGVVTIDTTEPSKDVVTTLTTTADGKTQVQTTTTNKVPVLGDLPVVGKLFQNSSDKPAVVTLDGGRVYTIQSDKVTQSGDTIVVVPKDGKVYLRTEEPSKGLSYFYTRPQLKLDGKNLPTLKLYYGGKDLKGLKGLNINPAIPQVYVDKNRFSLSQAQPKVWTVTPDAKNKVYQLWMSPKSNPVKAWSVVPDGKNRAFELWSKPKSNQTTVYIDGDHIKVVGDNIKVVHVDSKDKKTKKPANK